LFVGNPKFKDSISKATFRWLLKFIPAFKPYSRDICPDKL